MQLPLVSIITPTFNAGKFIASAITSVQNQTYTNWEMIIIDDCSSDGTVDLVTEIIKIDPRVKLIKLQNNSGTGIARNTGLKEAAGAFIAFLDSDDLWKPSKLEKQLAFMKVNNQPFTFSFYDCINEQSEPIGKLVQAPLNLSYFQLFFCNFVGNLTGIYEVSFFGKIPIASTRKRQDWMMWLTILQKVGSAKPVPESLASYRVRKNSISASKFDLIKYNFAVYRNFHKLNLFVATIIMAGFLFTQLIVKPFYIKKIKA